MSTLRHHLAALLIAIAAASPVVSFAQPTPAPVMPSPVSAHVDVSIMVVAATEGAGPSDPRLEAWMPLLKVTPFQSFQMLDAHELRLGDTEEQAMRLSEGRRVRIQLLSHDLSQARLRVELMNGEDKAVDTTVTITRNKSFFLVVRGKEGAALLVPIVVRY
jgi:hypothetical protein